MTTYQHKRLEPDGGGGSNPDFPWIDTGLTLNNGDHLTVVADGLVHLYGPAEENKMPWVGPDGWKDGDLPQSYLIDFDGGYAYTIEQGYLSGSGYIEFVGIDDSDPYPQGGCEVRIDFDSPLTINDLSFDYWSTWSEDRGDDHFWRVQCFDSDDNLLDSPIATNADKSTISKSTWYSTDESFYDGTPFPLADVSYIKVLFRTEYGGPFGVFGESTMRLDNILINTGMTIPNSFPARLIGKVGSQTFDIGSDYDAVWDGSSGDLYITVNDYPDTYDDNRGAFDVHLTVDAPDQANHDGTCPAAYDTEPTSPYPIKLRDGDKVLSATDIAVQTPTGPLAFTRFYRQSQQTDADYQFMGLGWSHNHRFQLALTGTSPNRTATISLPEGGTLQLTEDSGDAGHFDALAGSVSVLDHDSGNNEYILTTQDKRQYVFDDSTPYVLKRQVWPNDEAWTYTYDGNDNLTDVVDDYGRGLQLSYYSGLSGGDAFKNGQLWRVGDHDATGLGSSSPSGRYIELDYVGERLDGSLVTNYQALLSDVVDVRGQDWLYDYYGQDSGEDESDWGNYLVEVLSPSVDTTGDGSTDGRLTLQRLTYSHDQDLAVNGDMELDSDWFDIPDLAPSTNEQSTTQVDSGTYSRHVDADSTDEGIQGRRFNLVDDRDYTITARVYPVSGTVKMQVSEESAFDDSSTGTGAWETLTASHTPTATSTDHALQFIASGGAAEFYVDNVTIIETATGLSSIVQELGVESGNPLQQIDFAFQPGGRNATTESIDGQVSTHHFANGVYLAGRNPQGALNVNVLDDTYRPIRRVDAKANITQLNWSTDGKLLTKVTDALDSETDFAYNTDDTLDYSLDDEGRKTTYTYGDSNNPRLPTIVKVLDTDGTTVLQWQSFTYDSRGRTLTEKVIDPADGTTVLQETTRTYYASGDGDGLLETVTREDIGGTDDVTTTYFYDSLGRVIQTNQNSTFGSCTKSYTVYDEAGNMVASICNYVNTGNAPTDADEAADLYDPLKPDENHVTTHEYDTAGRRVATTTMAGSSEATTSLTVYDSLNRVIRTISNYVEDVSITHPYTEARGSFDHGDDGTENRISETSYNARGLVEKQADALGDVTLYGYDEAGRQVKVVRNASNTSYDMAADPDLSAYTPNTEPDEDIISETRYDANGNVIQTTDVLGNVTYTQYDELNRVVKTVRNAKDAATIDLYTNDPNYDEDNDPFSSNYETSDDPDRDLITQTSYDSMGRVVWTSDVLGHKTRQVYDALGRTIRTIQNWVDNSVDPALWEWDDGLQQWEDGSNNAIDHGTNNDQNIIRETVYDDDGRVLYNLSVLGAHDWTAYDGLGRQIKSIINAQGTATDGGSNDPRSSSYTPDTDPDKDIISLTVYDSDGRVEYTEDVLGRKTRQVYDEMGRRVRTVQNWVDNSVDPADWEWDSGDSRWEDGASNPISHGTDKDENIISDTIYDDVGRVWQTRDQRGNITWQVYDSAGRRVKTIVNCTYTSGSPAPEDDTYVGSSDADKDIITETEYNADGRAFKSIDAAANETRFEYDALGRRVKTIVNYVNGVFDSQYPDEDLISETEYNKAGQVLSTTDVRGTKTAFTYDDAGRRLTTTQAAETDLAVTSYTCYDTAGRVLRRIRNWFDNGVSPDAQDGGGDWLFNPTHHGTQNDRNLISSVQHDALGRVIKTIDALGHETTTDYAIDGQVVSRTDPLGVISYNLYDETRRLTRVIQNYVDNTVDPGLWVWDSGDTQWEDGSNSAISHGTENDENIIAQVTLDKAGRRLTLRDPRGNLTTYAYDDLNRRLSLTNPLSHVWTTAYENLSNGGRRVTMTDPLSHAAQQDFDRAGRLATIDYLSESPKLTPDVIFSYDKQGNRTLMEETINGGTSYVRKTGYQYDDARRLIQVDFDMDGDDVVDESVQYTYEAGGLRTQLELPDAKTIVYTYDEQGRLIGLEDWDNQVLTYRYDLAGRMRSAENDNGLERRHDYDAGGRLRQMAYATPDAVLGHFAYTLDARGNRIATTETLKSPTAGSTTLLSDDDALDYYAGIWSASGAYMQSTNFSAALRLAFLGDEITLTLGQDSDHGICDIYVNNVLWGSLDTYAASAGDEALTLYLDSDGPHVLDIRNRPDNHMESSGHRLSFKQLVTNAQYDLHTVQYSYDGLSRLIVADYFSGENVDGTAFREYDFAYDLAGNRTQQVVEIAGSPTTTNYTYDAANRLTAVDAQSITYNNAGQMTDDGTLTYSWDRGGRLLSAGGSSYAYNGLGNRLSQTVSAVVTDYLLDVQPGLSKVLAATTASDTTRFVHDRMGIQAQQDPTGDWSWTVQDGLGSVCGQVDDTVAMQGSRHFAPYGEPFGVQGSFDLPFGFTGEPTDVNGLVHLRARYLNPELGLFPSLDPVEGALEQLMSLNRYVYTGDNPINRTDLSGRIWWTPSASPSIAISATDRMSQRIQWLAELLNGPYKTHLEYPLYVPRPRPASAPPVDPARPPQHYGGFNLDVIFEGPSIKYWEIKPNTPTGKDAGNTQLNDKQAFIRRVKRAGGQYKHGPLDGTNTPHPTGAYGVNPPYDWNLLNWQRGKDFYAKIPIAYVAGSNDTWYAGQHSTPGLIVYWRESTREEPPPRSPLPPAISRAESQEAYRRKGWSTWRPQSPSNVIPFPSAETGEEDVEEQQAAFQPSPQVEHEQIPTWSPDDLGPVFLIPSFGFGPNAGVPLCLERW